MVDPALVGIILAAGSSSRFNAENKICAPLKGVPLGLHVGRAMIDIKLAGHIVVTGAESDRLPWTGYRRILNARPDLGLSESIRLGVAAAVEARADAVILALADMPFVTTDILRDLIRHYEGPSTMMAVSDGKRRTPPALFGSAWFDRLLHLSGDQGARDLVKEAAILTVRSEDLFDIDRTSDLETASQGTENFDEGSST